jgi:MFS family permease
VPLLVTVRFHASATIAGLALSAATLAWTIGAWAQARLAATSNRAVLVATGTGLIGLGIVGVTLAVRESAPLALVWGGWAVAGLGMGLAHATISLVVLEEAPDGGVGAASAAMQITSAIGVALGTGATGTLMSMSASQTRGLVLGFLTTTAAAAAALVVAARLPGRRR